MIVYFVDSSCDFNGILVQFYVYDHFLTSKMVTLTPTPTPVSVVLVLAVLFSFQLSTLLQ